MTDTVTSKEEGLTTTEAGKLQEEFGKNQLEPQKKENFLKNALHIICEPMFMLLLVAAAIYFLLGEPGDGIIMLVFVVGIILIEVIQEWKTDRTLNVFFASTFWTKLQTIFGHCCMSKLDKVAKPWLAMFRPAI